MLILAGLLGMVAVGSLLMTDATSATDTSTDDEDHTPAGDVLVSYLDTSGEGASDIVTGSEGGDLLFGTAGSDIVDGAGGDDAMLLGRGADTAHGGSGQDTLHGEAGDDWLSGGLGADVLSGGDGDDTLVLGQGDIATGGAGEDRFLVHTGTGEEVPLISDFASGVDSLVVTYDATIGAPSFSISAHPEIEDHWQVAADGIVVATVAGEAPGLGDIQVEVTT